MILSVSAQATAFLWLVASGAVSGLLFDVFRAVRRVQPHPNALTQAEDVLYWLSVFLLVLYLLLTHNSGEMRGFVLLGFVLGMILYFSACSWFVLRGLVWIVAAVKRVLCTCLLFLTWPMRWLRRVLRVPISKCRKFAKKCVISVKKGLHKARVCVRIRAVGVANDVRTLRKKT